jgi:nicotinamidase-related amidase
MCRFFFVPHHRAEPSDFDGWDHPTPYQRAGSQMQAFAKDTWGGAFRDEFAAQPGDTVIHEHWTASGFANTDLDFQLKQKRISRVIIIGLIANTCIEGTARTAVDLGYHVTLVRDATAAFSHDAMHAAHDINAPNFAHAVVTTPELLSML